MYKNSSSWDNYLYQDCFMFLFHFGLCPAISVGRNKGWFLLWCLKHSVNHVTSISPAVGCHTLCLVWGLRLCRAYANAPVPQLPSGSPYHLCHREGLSPLSCSSLTVEHHFLCVWLCRKLRLGAEGWFMLFWSQFHHRSLREGIFLALRDSYSSGSQTVPYLCWFLRKK